MDSVPEIRLAGPPEPRVNGSSTVESPATSRPGSGALELPPARGPSLVVLVALAGLAGMGAIVLGGWAVFSGARSAPESVVVRPELEQGLSLLAKPSTERIPFDGSGGRLVLAVGSGGKAALVLRRLERLPPGKTYAAWIVTPGLRSARGGTFTGAERVVPLAQPVARGSSVRVVVESPDGSEASRPHILFVARRSP